MTNKKLESLLLGTRQTPSHYSAFTKQVMAKIPTNATFTNSLRTTSKQPKWRLLMKFRTLHGAGLVVAILAVMALLTGVVYAGIRFAPDLIQLFDKRTNEQGRIEYSVPSFAQCQHSEVIKTDTFAVKPDVSIDDTEVRNILKAKCELHSIERFASETWPTYGQNKEWKSGDTIYYTRPDILGTVTNINARNVTIQYGGQQAIKTYQTFDNKDLLAYTHGQQIPVAEIKPGDFVFAIERVAETYDKNITSKQGDVDPTKPASKGIVAVVKMSLAPAYYAEKQSQIYEVQPCAQNPNETCPKEFQSGIDVFPRGSEGASNPNLRRDVPVLMREINGIVTDISDTALTLKSNKGNTFTIHLAKTIIDDYNTNVAPIYQQNGRFPLSKVSVNKGSWVSVNYVQAKSDDPRNIRLADIAKIYLLTDLPSK